MASLEVHGVIGPTTLPLLCAEQTMANHCKTQFARIGPILSILLSPLTFLCRSWSLGLGTSGNLGNRVKKWLFRRYCRCKKNGKPCYHEHPTHWSNLQYNHPKWPNVEGFFPSTVCSNISHSCVSVSCLFGSLGSLRVLFAMQETFWQQDVFFKSPPSDNWTSNVEERFAITVCI